MRASLLFIHWASVYIYITIIIFPPIHICHRCRSFLSLLLQDQTAEQRDMKQVGHSAMIIPAVLKPFAIPSAYFNPEEHLKSSVHMHSVKRTATHNLSLHFFFLACFGLVWVQIKKKFRINNLPDKKRRIFSWSDLTWLLFLGDACAAVADCVFFRPSNQLKAVLCPEKACLRRTSAPTRKKSKAI